MWSDPRECIIVCAICSLFLICTVKCHSSVKSSVRMGKNSDIVGFISLCLDCTEVVMYRNHMYWNGTYWSSHVPKWTCTEVSQNQNRCTYHFGTYNFMYRNGLYWNGRVPIWPLALTYRFGTWCISVRKKIGTWTTLVHYCFYLHLCRSIYLCLSGKHPTPVIVRANSCVPKVLYVGII